MYADVYFVGRPKNTKLLQDGHSYGFSPHSNCVGTFNIRGNTGNVQYATHDVTQYESHLANEHIEVLYL